MEAPKLFALLRMEDETGSSGIGIVAFGVVWENGTINVQWRSDFDDGANGSNTLWVDMPHLLKSAGHGGKTVVMFIETKFNLATDEDFTPETEKQSGDIGFGEGG